MANIFRKKDAYIDRVNRSTFDLSFVNNLTIKFGAITPVCLLPASFGDSFQINARFNLQLLPTAFPIQTQLYARLHFVYVRTRTLWKDWMSFFGGDETVTPPYMQVSGDNASGTPYFNMSDLQTGTLADYLGIPTTITGSYGSEIRGLRRTPFYTANRVSPFGNLIFTHLGNVNATTGTIDKIIEKQGSPISSILVDAAPAVPNYYGCKTTINAVQYDFSGVQSTDKPIIRVSLVGFPELKDLVSTGRLGCIFSVDGSTATSCAKINNSALKGDYIELPFNAGSNVSSFTFYLLIEYTSSRETVSDNLTVSYVTSSNTYWYGILEKFLDLFNNLMVSAVMSSSEWTRPQKENCPFYTEDWKKLPPIPLSALPFRAYEAYYNAFGRDIRNNPFIVDGKPEYNRYVPSVEGGGDIYPYRLHYANWEPDAYTTALQSPQAGIAPLVGITSLGEATFRDESGVEYHAQLETADDGDTVTGFQVKSSNAPADVIRNLIGLATSGVSISDIRNVNSLQRFLEIRIRQSPRYKNLVKGLFDVNLDYDELMMPEFLGGISDTIPVYKVTQTSPTEGNPLGSFAGQGSLQSGMRHVIRKYCPEDGYILGVMSVVPAANYSQLLAPHFTRMNLLDWHFPQFNNISYQPMLYKHLCPYQAYAVNPANVNNVFGYQRAYWDLISSFDEVHGEFRGSMRNFLINRVFDKAPELSQDFLLVNPDHVNDVFAMTSENGDKILGSIAFDIVKKTTIPRNSIPHIE
nr:MAG TPA: Major capsid protein [Microviridae sp.]